MNAPPDRAISPHHAAEYAAEALGLGLFMISACLFTTAFEWPGSPLVAAIPDGDLRRAIIGVAMGASAIALIHSPWGKRSGAHLNPAVTLAFLRLGRVARRDAAGYVLAQFAGGTLGVFASAALLGPRLADRAVNYAVTVPGMWGIGAAFATEMGMAFGLMTLVLNANAHPRLARFTGFFAGLTVATYIALLGPLSGMSMNPARTFASDSIAHVWTAWWLYFIAPPAGMLLAAELFDRRHPAREQGCAKLHHAPGVRCIFCEHREARASAPAAAVLPVPTWIPQSRAD